MKYATIQWELEDGVEEFLLVRYHQEPSYPEVRTGHPDNWKPAEGGGIDIDGVWLNGKAIPDKLQRQLERNRRFIREIEAIT